MRRPLSEGGRGARPPGTARISAQPAPRSRQLSRQVDALIARSGELRSHETRPPLRRARWSEVAPRLSRAGPYPDAASAVETRCRRSSLLPPPGEVADKPTGG